MLERVAMAIEWSAAVRTDLRLLLLGVLSWLIAASHAPAACSADLSQKLANIHKIGVSSNLGDQAEVAVIGSTYRDTRYDFLKISDWDLNDLATQEARKALDSRFQVQSTPIDLAKIAAAAIAQSKDFNLAYAVRSLPPSDVDAYLILWADGAYIPGSGDPSVAPKVNGLGVYRLPEDGIGFGDRHQDEAIVHLVFTAYLMDARTGKAIAFRSGRISRKAEATSPDPSLLSAEPPHFPHVFTGEHGWPTATSLNDQQKQILRGDLTALIKASISSTLVEMGMVPK